MDRPIGHKTPPLDSKLPFNNAVVIFLAFVLSSSILRVRADPNDWINPAYVLQASQQDLPATRQARQQILTGAKTSARNGPWSVTTTDVAPPSGDHRDYFSWAPYHWPDCQWCNNTSTKPSKGDSGGGGGGAVKKPPADAPNAAGPVSDPSEEPNDANDDPDSESDGDPNQVDNGNGGPRLRRSLMQEMEVNGEWDVDPLFPPKMEDDDPSEPHRTATRVFYLPSTTIPTSWTHPSSMPDAPLPTLHPAHSKRAKAPKMAAKGKTSSCTPSPTTSMAPSATWTTCKYVQKDGQVNPDVRSLMDGAYIGYVSQSSIFNAVSYALTGKSDYARITATYVDAFFIDPKTGMNPNVNYGQIVRGPGKQMGSMMAVLDVRGITKVANAVQILRQGKSPEWTVDRDKRMVQWATAYINWLKTSPIASKAAVAANNHATFYFNQLAALQIIIGDLDGARKSIMQYFNSQFKDQIVASGEQPYEAIRTRPFHYRCFNLEAMVVNAKLGDQLGLNMWTARSKYNATIQTAVDFTMGLKWGKEDPTELVPHMAAIVAAFGDPTGKYARYMDQVLPDYQSKSWYFSDQTEAFITAPRASQRSKSSSNSNSTGGGGGGGGAGSQPSPRPSSAPAKPATGKNPAGKANSSQAQSVPVDPESASSSSSYSATAIRSRALSLLRSLPFLGSMSTLRSRGLDLWREVAGEDDGFGFGYGLGYRPPMAGLVDVPDRWMVE